MQNDSFKCVGIMRLIIEVKNPTTQVKSIYSELNRWDISLPLNMTYFFLHVILSMSSEQTCLQGFANEDIHKAQAFCKNAKR